MLGFEDGKAMEEMHVVMREESRVESCTLGLWVWPTRLPGNAHPCQIGKWSGGLPVVWHALRYRQPRPGEVWKLKHLK
jgi:hypothetical protein